MKTLYTLIALTYGFSIAIAAPGVAGGNFNQADQAQNTAPPITAENGGITPPTDNGSPPISAGLLTSSVSTLTLGDNNPLIQTLSATNCKACAFDLFRNGIAGRPADISYSSTAIANEATSKRAAIAGIISGSSTTAVDRVWSMARTFIDAAGKFKVDPTPPCMIAARRDGAFKYVAAPYKEEGGGDICSLAARGDLGLLDGVSQGQLDAENASPTPLPTGYVFQGLMEASAVSGNQTIGRDRPEIGELTGDIIGAGLLANSGFIATAISDAYGGSPPDFIPGEAAPHRPRGPRYNDDDGDGGDDGDDFMGEL